jgi:hypothetical protein
VIEKAAVLVVCDDENGFVPNRAVSNSFIDVLYQLFSKGHIMIGVLVSGS